jgi:NTP pyrophosphatase (non-canonical NTP hydrolase)
MSKQKLMNEIQKWSDNQFDNGNFTPERSVSISHHLQKEAVELTESIKKYFENPTSENKESMLFEIADCYMLLDDCATHLSVTSKDIKKIEWKKLEINKKRIWGTPDANGVVEHIDN